MVKQTRIPHEIFKHILSYKDPRYEKVRAPGDPFLKSPSRVWYTVNEFKRQKEVPLTIFRQRDESEGYGYNPWITLGVRNNPYWRGYNYRHFKAREGIRDIEMRMDPDMYIIRGDADKTCPRKLAEMSMQCEACGDEDLFVHDYARHMAVSNK